MNKIGIITFHASHNCGSMLQAYSLQKNIEKLFNTKVEIINYSSKFQREYYSLFSPNRNIRKILKNCLFLTNFKKIRNHFNDYNRFIDKELVLSDKEYSTEEELKDEEFEYSTIVAGSDQCWNINCPDGGDAYFINFVKGKAINKVAYAPSLGSSNIVKFAKKPGDYKELLCDFSGLSVRERNAQRWLTELTGRTVDLLVDPTMLFDKQEWLNQFNLPNRRYKNYIFYYAFKYDDEVNEAVKCIAKKYKKDVYVIDAKAWTRKALWRYGFKLTKNGGPFEFLCMIRDSDFVLTTSFHGTVFSSIFHKQFWFLNSSMHSADDDRATSLLAQIGLENRFVSLEELQQKDINSPIDYKRVDSMIAKEKKRACDYLQKYVK